MLSIHIHEGNAKWDDTENASHPSQNGNHQENNKYWQGCQGEENLIHCLWGCKLMQPLYTSLWKFPKNLKIEIACHLLVIYLKEYKSVDNRNTYTSIFVAELFVLATLWNQPMCSSAD
jgi:hypothetical protein